MRICNYSKDLSKNLYLLSSTLIDILCFPPHTYYYIVINAISELFNLIDLIHRPYTHGQRLFS